MTEDTSKTEGIAASDWESITIGKREFGRAHVTRALQVKLSRIQDEVNDTSDEIVGLEAEMTAVGNAIAALVEVVPFDTKERDRLMGERRRLRREVRALTDAIIEQQVAALALRLDPAPTAKYLLDNLDNLETANLRDWLDEERPTAAPTNGSS